MSLKPSGSRVRPINQNDAERPERALPRPLARYAKLGTRAGKRPSAASIANVRIAGQKSYFAARAQVPAFGTQKPEIR